MKKAPTMPVAYKQWLDAFPKDFHLWAWWFTDISIDAPSLREQWPPLYERWKALGRPTWQTQMLVGLTS